MARETADKKSPKQAKDEYLEKFDIYGGMAYYVAKILNIRPNDILDGWGVPELIVTYGHYANEQARRNYEEWKHLDPKTKAKYGEPPEVVVYFHGED